MSINFVIKLIAHQLCLILLVPYQVRGSGRLQIYLQTYEFDRQPRPSSNSQGSKYNLTVPLSFAQAYEPQWKLMKVFGQEETDDDNTTPIPLGEDGSAVVQWPWQEDTECSSPSRYRFVVCLDYEGSFDPSYPCSLQRVETDILPIDRALPFSASERLTFRTLLRARKGAIISNPFEVQFDVWKGPVRLSIFITCCGASSLLEGQCNEVLTSTISAWPRAATDGSQTLRYRLAGRGSMSVIANAVCDPDYFSHSCDIYCKVESPGTEHAFCNSTTGARQCLAGYEGPDCQVDVDECLMQSAAVCKNGGVCRNSLGSFSCSCPFGTTGRTCEQRYPVCHLRPCQHQGTCLETTSGSLCMCMPGFAGQWCHMLEGQEDQRSEVPQTRNEDNQSASTPATVAFSTPVSPAAVDPSSSRTPKKQDDNWHDWYLVLIFGIIFLVVIITIIVFLVCKKKVRKRYQVSSGSLMAMTNTATIAAAPTPESCQTGAPRGRAAKTRSFNNAVYDDEERVSGFDSTPSSFHILYNNGSANNHTNSLGSSCNHAYGNANSIALSNNNILNARALMQQNSTGKVDFNDKTLLKPKSMSNKMDGNAKGSNDLYEEQVHPSKCSGHVVDLRGTQASQSSNKARQVDGRTEGYVNQEKEKNRSNVSEEAATMDYSACQEVPHGDLHPADRRGPGAPLSQTVDQAVRQSEKNLAKQGQRLSKRKSEHFYEDIDAEYGFNPYIPKPKPRSIHNVKSETLRRKDYARNADDGPEEKTYITSKLQMSLAPLPPSSLSATAVASAVFSSRLHGSHPTSDTLPAPQRPVSVRYEQPRNSDGSLDYSPSQIALPTWPVDTQAQKTGTYRDQYVKSYPEVSVANSGTGRRFHNDKDNVYCLQQGQRKSDPKGFDPGPRPSIHHQWKNQPPAPLPPQPKTSHSASGRREPLPMVYSTDSSQFDPLFNSVASHSQKPYHREPYLFRPENNDSKSRANFGYVSNQDPCLTSTFMPGPRRGSMDALLDSMKGTDSKAMYSGLYEPNTERKVSNTLHGYGESSTAPVGRARRRSEPFIGMAHTSELREFRETAVGANAWGSGQRGQSDRRQSSQRDSGHGGSTLSMAPNVASSFV